MSCCADSDHPGGSGAADETQTVPNGFNALRQKFQEFLKSAGAPGALDAHTKCAVSIALSVLSKCEPCVRAHVAKARDLGFSQEQIDEAAWMAVAFGGSPTMMFYVGTKRP